MRHKAVLRLMLILMALGLLSCHSFNGNNATKVGAPPASESDCYAKSPPGSAVQVHDQSASPNPQPLAEAPPDCNFFTLQLLHFSDIDGGRDIIANAVTFSRLVAAFRPAYPTLILSSGDNWIPGPEYQVASDSSLAPYLGVPAAGRAHMALLNAMGVQASAFGNHEFDRGTEAVAAIIAPETSPEHSNSNYPGAAFAYLAANMNFTTDAHLGPLQSQPGQDAVAAAGGVTSSVVLTAAGEPIGVVGATTPALKALSSPGELDIIPKADATPSTIAATIQPAVDALRTRGINKVILLAHMQQLAIERNLAAALDGVDIIVAGGSNTILADTTDRLLPGDEAQDTYPVLLQSLSGEPVALVNTDGDFTYLGRLVVTFDHEGLLLPTSIQAAISGAYASDEATAARYAQSTAPSPEVLALSQALTDALTSRAGNTLGRTDVYLNGERKALRTEETNLGNLTADANLAYAQRYYPSTAVSIKNAGGIRASIGHCTIPPGDNKGDSVVCRPPAGIKGVSVAGEITQLDVATALSFNNSLRVLKITGRQLKQLLEHGVAATADGATPGQFPQVAGLQFSFDPKRPAQQVDLSGSHPVVVRAGERVRNLVIMDANGTEPGAEPIVVVRDGHLVAPDAIVGVVSLDFLVQGGDGYPFPSLGSANGESLAINDLASGLATFAAAGSEQDALAEYLLAHYPANGGEVRKRYATEDTRAQDDRRIQNLDRVREDTVLEGVE